MSNLTVFNPLDYRSYPSRKLSAQFAKATEHHIYECPSDRTATVESMWIVNTHSGNEAVRVHHCRAGENPVASNALVYDLGVNSKTTTVFDQPIFMVGGDRIWVLASASDRVAITLYGSEA